MTTANFLNVSAVKGPQVDVSKKLQEEAREVSEIFAAMMNQTVDAPTPMVEDAASENLNISTDGNSTIADSYERYSYKDKQIETAKEEEIPAEELEAVEETLEAAEEEILNTLSEEYGVDVEKLQNLLDEMGLTVLDLLNPQNLVSFVMALTGITSGEELLLDESFLKVMEGLETLSNNLMKELGVDHAGLQDLISMMETEDVSFEQVLETVEATEPVIVDQVPEEVTETNVQNVENTETADTAEEGVKVQVEEQSDTTEKKEDVTKEGNVAEISETGEEATLSGNKDSGNDSLWNQNTESNQVFVTGQSTTQTGQVNDLSQMQFNSYFSVETAQIMEQIAEQIRIVVTPDTTSMEMQLNPENLGKMYLHISSEEGIVNAQFIATNEVVKEALESQIATLRENLTQAGVKVDAIEVTIASHEFERNLEQNQKNPEEQMVQEEKQQRRRNLTADSLDELSGIMTEEETLVAQIMRDNGNTIDFTA